MARRKKRKVKPIVNKEDRETWSDLPIELLHLILSRLAVKEVACASAVCKSWFSVVMSIRALGKNPLLLRIPKSSDVFELYNPSTRKTNYLELPQLDGCDIFSCTIDGWLLVSERTQQRVFFFNVYTLASKELPRFCLLKSLAGSVAFSSSPVSTDCTVFAVQALSLHSVTVSTCNFKSMEWMTKVYTNVVPDDSLGKLWVKIIYSEKLLYCMCSELSLQIFNTQTCEWSLNVVPHPELPLLPGENNWIGYMAEHKGDIFLLFTCGVKGPIIFKLDEIREKWEETKTLEGVSFFVDTWSGLAGLHVSRTKANNIYFSEVSFYGQRCIRYSVNEGRYYPNKKYSLPLPQEEGLVNIWINPPADDVSLM